jgi:hypothetical protein
MALVLGSLNLYDIYRDRVSSGLQITSSRRLREAQNFSAIFLQQNKPRSLLYYAIVDGQDQSIVVQSGCGAGMIVFTRKIKPKIVSGCDPS